MPRVLRPFALLRSGDRLPALFAVGILLPGILLAVFSGRALLQERRLAAQQVRDRLDGFAAVAARDLDEELRRWQSAIYELSNAAGGRVDTESMPASAEWPTRVRQAVGSPAGAVLITAAGGRVDTFPPGQLLYPPLAAPRRDSPARSTTLESAHAAEMRDEDYARAADLYERLLTAPTADERAAALHGIARVARKTGALREALRHYEALAAAGDVRLASLPVQLIAGFEICGLLAELGEVEALNACAHDLYTGLVAGHWPLEKVRYTFYSDQVRQWLATEAPPPTQAPSSLAELDDLRKLESSKLALSALAADFVRAPGAMLVVEGHAGFAFWNEDPFVALVLSAATFDDLVWRPLSERIDDPAIALNLQAADGTVVLGTKMPAETMLWTARELTASDVPMRLQVWPSDLDALQADMTRRQSLYLAMLVLVLTLLAFGSYLTVRTARREVEMARLKARFVSAVSHEFRSPLTGIRQLAEMLARGRVPTEERKLSYYRMIAGESSRLTRLVENVLDFSRIEEQRREYADEIVATSRWLADVVDEFRREIADHRVTVAADIPERLPPVRGDREALTCAVHNLLDNAVKYSAGAGTVWLAAAAANGHVSVRVRDEGIGISPKDRHRIFEKFFRSTDHGADEVKGVGLGLSLVQHIVTAHGGTVGVESQPGEGSTFTIDLPAAVSARRVADPAPGESD